MNEKTIIEYEALRDKIEVRADEILSYYNDLMGSRRNLLGFYIDRDIPSIPMVELMWEDRNAFRGEGTIYIPLCIYYGDWKNWVEDYCKRRSIVNVIKVILTIQEDCKFSDNEYLLSIDQLVSGSLLKQDFDLAVECIEGFGAEYYRRPGIYAATLILRSELECQHLRSHYEAKDPPVYSPFRRYAKRNINHDCEPQREQQ